MPDLTASNLEAYTKGRLLASDPETQRILDRALAAVRRYCEWHVNPVLTDHVVTLDGPGKRALLLPTMKLVALKSVTEDGIPLDLSNIRYSAGGPVRLRKRGFTSWSCNYSSIVVVMDHGFDDDECMDWRLAVLDAADRAAEQVGVGGAGPLKRYRVDDVEREWFNAAVDDALMAVMNTRLLDPFKIEAP